MYISNIMTPGIQTETFFQTWEDAPENQLKYEQRVKELWEMIKKIHGENYFSAFHDNIIREIARSELVCHHYEWLIANNREESPNAIFVLKNERQQLNKNRSLLSLDIKGTRTAHKEDKDDTKESKNAKESLMLMLKKAKEAGDI